MREVTVGTPLPAVELTSEATVKEHDADVLMLVGTEVFENAAR